MDFCIEESNIKDKTSKIKSILLLRNIKLYIQNFVFLNITAEGFYLFIHFTVKTCHINANGRYELKRPLGK